MSNLNHLVEQQVKEYESKLKHIDEMLDHAHDKLSTKDVAPKEQTEFEKIQRARHQLNEDIQLMKLISKENWETDTIENAGPMGVWDIVAQRLEKFIERIDKS